MRREARAEQARLPDKFRDGLEDWWHGRDTPAAAAAGSILAETILRARVYLEAQTRRNAAP